MKDTKWRRLLWRIRLFFRRIKEVVLAPTRWEAYGLGYNKGWSVADENTRWHYVQYLNNPDFQSNWTTFWRACAKPLTKYNEGWDDGWEAKKKDIKKILGKIKWLPPEQIEKLGDRLLASWDPER